MCCTGPAQAWQLSKPCDSAGPSVRCDPKLLHMPFSWLQSVSRARHLSHSQCCAGLPAELSLPPVLVHLCQMHCCSGLAACCLVWHHRALHFPQCVSNHRSTLELQTLTCNQCCSGRAAGCACAICAWDVHDVTATAAKVIQLSTPGHVRNPPWTHRRHKQCLAAEHSLPCRVVMNSGSPAAGAQLASAGKFCAPAGYPRDPQ